MSSCEPGAQAEAGEKRKRSMTKAGSETQASKLRKSSGTGHVAAIVQHTSTWSRDIESAYLDVKDAAASVHALFTWQDGPLVEAMKHGHIFLMDEISLVS
jgi:midasin (ATPase involved in ribosome maturation)